MNKIKSRLLVSQALLDGKITLSQAIRLALPSSLCSQETEQIRQIVVLNQYHIELIKDGDTVVDAGANMGMFSVWVAKNYRHSHIYAFEPTPETFAILQKNIAPYPNIKAFNCALGEKAGHASIVVMESSGSNYIGKGGIPVEIKTIDSMNIKLNFLKMDTEGYEGNILKGAAQTIRENKPIIAMSAYHHPEDKIELPKILNSIAPYECELRHDCEEDFICKPL
jgi:FkbM family methyltransferase